MVLIGAALLGLVGLISIVRGLQNGPDVIVEATVEDKARQSMLQEASKFIIGTWHDENSLCTYCTDGTIILKFDSGGTLSGKWSIEGDILTNVFTERDGKALDNSKIYRARISDVNDSTFVSKHIQSGAEFRATKVK